MFQKRCRRCVTLGSGKWVALHILVMCVCVLYGFYLFNTRELSCCHDFIFHTTLFPCTWIVKIDLSQCSILQSPICLGLTWSSYKYQNKRIWCCSCNHSLKYYIDLVCSHFYNWNMLHFSQNSNTRSIINGHEMLITHDH